MSARRYTVKCLAAGQPRPYADTREHYLITFEWQGMEGFKNPEAPFVPATAMTTERVKSIARGLIGGWCEEGEGNWASRRLTRCVCLGKGVWELILISPFTD